jgi:ligand-binding sensor domain-containing protein/signal transduction histidine kinase
MQASPGCTRSLFKLVALLFVALRFCSGGISAWAFDSGSVLGEYRVRAWRQEQGLPDNRVNAILQTRDGYLWIATRSGLARFDGLTFRVFNRANTPAMTSMDCRALAEDEDGSLWIGTVGVGNGLGLVRLQGQTLTCFPRDALSLRGDVDALVPRVGGGVWLIGGTGHLAWFQPDKSPRPFIIQALSGVKVLALESPRLLWVGTDKGLYQLDSTTGAILGGPEIPRASSPEVTAILPEVNGRLWAIFTRPRGFNFLFRREQGVWVSCADEEVSNGSRSDFLVRDLDGYRWLATQKEHLLRWDKDRGSPVPIPWETEEGFAQSACIDQDGSLWVGTENNGLYQLHRSGLQRMGRSEGLPSDNAMAVYEAKDGGLWVGTDRGASHVANGQFTTYTQRQGLARNDVTAFAEDASRTMWVGTGNGLDAFAAGTLTHHRFHGPPNFFDPDEIAHNKVRALLSSRDGSIWVALQRGVHRLYQGRDDLYTETNGLPNLDVRALLEDSTGALWMGTDGGGVTRLRGGQFTTLARTNGLSNDHVWALLQDKQGIVWIGTEHGLNRYEAGHITQFTTRQGLLDDLIINLLEDDNGWFWIGSHRGIYRANRQELNDVASGRTGAVHASQVDAADGFPGGDINGTKSQPSALKTHAGRLCFCTSKGLVVIDPKLMNQHDKPPPVIIEQMRANDRVVFGDGLEELPETSDHSASGANRSLTEKLSAAASDGVSLRLAPGNGQVLEFHYTAGTFLAAEKARFRYRLEGYETAWHDADSRRVAYYTNLSPGHYRFHVMAANHHNIWNETGAALGFYLAPFYYQTWWFRCALVAAIAAAVLVITTWRVKEVRRMSSLERELALAGERSRIARDLHDGLGAGLTQLRMLATLAERDLPRAASLGEHLGRISTLTREVARSLKDIVWLAHPDSDTAAALTSRVCAQAEQLFKPTGVQCHFESKPLGPGRLGLAASQNVYLAALEGLNNVAKHAAATEVWVRSRVSEGVFEMVIESDGRDFRFGGESGDSGNQGHGLHTMRHRMASIGGEFAIVPRPGGGSKISIKTRIAP